ncbi:MAG: hypothetical protein LBV18_00205 [Alistipes sp.]|jgi:hypothetical protein|nr:hypothetical protein [Alistipes sp.]
MKKPAVLSGKYFDDNKSVVENLYYLLTVVSIVFIAVQVIIARDSLRRSAEAELISHTVEQSNNVKAALTSATDNFTYALKDGDFCTFEQYQNVTLQTRHLATLDPKELAELELIDYTKLIDEDGALDIAHIVFTSRIALLNEIDHLAFMVLNGLVSEELMYDNFGYGFLVASNMCATLLYSPQFMTYGVANPQLGSTRTLYDIWWLRDVIQKKEFIVNAYRAMLEGELPPYLDETEFRGLYSPDESYRLVSLEGGKGKNGGGDGGEVGEVGENAIRAEIKRIESEQKVHRKEFELKLKRTSVRNVE